MMMAQNTIPEEAILQWLFMYSCKKKYACSLEPFSQRGEFLNSNSLPGCHIRTASAMVYFIVTNGETRRYDEAIRIVEHIYSLVPSSVDALTFINFTLTLKFKYVMDELRYCHASVFSNFNKYFPRSTENVYACLPTALRSKVLKKIAHFRKFFLPLLNQPSRRLAYMETSYERDYGSEYDSELFNFVTRFCDSIESHLPPTKIDLILSSNVAPDDSSHYGIAMEILLDYCHGKHELSRQDVFELTSALGPDPVTTPHCFNAITSDESHNAGNITSSLESKLRGENSEDRPAANVDGGDAERVSNAYTNKTASNSDELDTNPVVGDGGDEWRRDSNVAVRKRKRPIASAEKTIESSRSDRSVVRSLVMSSHRGGGDHPGEFDSVEVVKAKRPTLRIDISASGDGQSATSSTVVVRPSARGTIAGSGVCERNGNEMQPRGVVNRDPVVTNPSSFKPDHDGASKEVFSADVDVTRSGTMVDGVAVTPAATVHRSNVRNESRDEHLEEAHHAESDSESRSSSSSSTLSLGYSNLDVTVVVKDVVAESRADSSADLSDDFMSVKSSSSFNGDGGDLMDESVYYETCTETSPQSSDANSTCDASVQDESLSLSRMIARHRKSSFSVPTSLVILKLNRNLCLTEMNDIHIYS